MAVNDSIPQVKMSKTRLFLVFGTCCILLYTLSHIYAPNEVLVLPSAARVNQTAVISHTDKEELATFLKPDLLQSSHWNAMLNLPVAEYKDQWDNVQTFRRNQVDRVCLHRGMTEEPFKPTFQMLVDTRHKVMFCYVPKVACTSWKAVLCQLMKEGVSKTTQQLMAERNVAGWPGERIHYVLQTCGLTSLDKLSDTEVKDVLENYTKIAAVRHPIERINSLYKQKLYTDPENHNSECHLCKSLGTKLIKRYRSNASVESLETGRGVTRPEFFKFLVEGREYNEHWTEYNRLCHPCHVHYDYILKLETMDMDAPQVITRAFNSTLPFVESNASNASHIKKDTLSPELKSQLLKRYGIDMDLFGYE